MIANPPPEPTWRKPAGVVLILMIIVGWSALVVSAAPTISGWPIAVQSAVYLIAGIIWIFPLRPLLLWMETGKWRE